MDYVTRREMLGLLGAAGAAALVRGRASRAGEIASSTSPACVVRPTETEGPYFVDELLHRADIRGEPAGGALSPGLPLRLRMTVHRVGDEACVPLAGAHVDLWQCDALGVYSDVRDFQGRFDTRGKRFLRGYQVSDRAGAVDFTTVYPGWYSGRTPHIHFKIRLFAERRKTYEFTSQLYFDDAVTDAVYQRAPYAGRGERDTRNHQDGIFAGPSADRTVPRDSGAQLLVAVARDGDGYAGRFDIGLKLPG